ncbi:MULTISPECIES: alpha/beta hydrolase-fold protein [unclassified Mycobacterium]|uniref:alpha/beta hydrolase n=1 Tax=unclassified Mycobacterium TaxID=2642494 RepID=UPI00336BF452
MPPSGTWVLAELPAYARNNPLYAGPSLIHGWLPVTIQVLAALALVAGLYRRPRSWLRVWVPSAAVCGMSVGALAYWYITSQGMADNPPPLMLWIWIGFAAVALVVLIAGWMRTAWMRRGAMVLAVPLCLVAALTVLNQWIDYYDTLRLAWAAVTAGPLPDEAELAEVRDLKGQGATATGRVVPVEIPADVSGFQHRTEYVYLPPAWFARPAPPKLPVVVMISGAWSTPADWVRQGNAAAAMDRFAQSHDGVTPVLVFVDTGGTFNNDTECVDGPRGNVAAHVTKEVIPYVNSEFGTSSSPANWGIVGWSMGGTCAADFAITHPELFHTFVDMAGDLTPNAGTKEQTVERLYGGDEKQWALFDTLSVIHGHRRYQDVAGWLDVSTTAKIRAGQEQLTGPIAARRLCEAALPAGIDCAVVRRGGNHDWAYAQEAFAQAFPWVAGRLGTPGVPSTPLPSSGS